jgi:Tol biopolymer transport system component
MKARKMLVIAGLSVALLLGLAGCEWFWTPEIPVVPAVGFAPVSGAVHTLVAVVGAGFGAVAGDGAVTFDGVPATLENWSDTNIVVRVPVLPTPTGQRNATVEVRKSGAVLGRGTFAVVRGVLFETHRDGNSEIYVMNPDGSQPTNLTQNAGSDTAASWSPDGTRIAFVSTRDGNSEIYVMNADGSNPVNLTKHANWDFFPVWSPNGRKIAFMTDRDGGGVLSLGVTPSLIMTFNIEIYVMNADGTGQTNLTNSLAWDGYPSWSPDGQRIVFQTDRDDSGMSVTAIVPSSLGYEIYAMNADGSNQTRLSNSPGHDVQPSWSPGGSKIVFESYRDGNAEIYVMNVDGTGQMRLTNHVAGDTMPTWSPNGAWITFHSDRDGSGEIYKMTATGSSLTRLTNAADWDGGASWSPDGSAIVFQSFRDGNAEIYRMNADGSGQQRLTNDTDWDSQPFWGTRAWALLP